jgi:hypothetical protein
LATASLDSLESLLDDVITAMDVHETHDDDIALRVIRLPR